MATGALPGFRDFYPEQFAQRAWLFERWREVARRFGYVEYDGPPLEPLDLYTKKSGEEIVGQLYNFEDKGGRQVSLRPEMTPTVARMVAARANALRKPVRWFSIPQLFRYERQQKGRLREHYQLNVDIFGEADVSADAELLAVACEIMRACGLGPDEVEARYSDRRLLTAILSHLAVPAESMSGVYAAIDKLERDPRAVFLEKLEHAGLSDAQSLEIDRIVRLDDANGLRLEFGHIPDVAQHLDRFAKYVSLLGAAGVGPYCQLDLSIVRGLAYYTGIVFEVFDKRREYRAICGGGRYDTLLSSLGGVDMPALGFGMGDVVLGELLKARGKMDVAAPAPDAWVMYQADEPEGLQRAVRLSARMRAIGMSVEYALRAQTESKQRKAAVQSGASMLVMIPPALDEWSGLPREDVIVRNQRDGEAQRFASDEALVHYLSETRMRSATGRP